MIYLVCDSTACLTRREAREMQVVMVPMFYMAKQGAPQREGFIDDPSPAQEAAPQALEGYTTSQAPTGAFLRIFSRLKQRGDQALCITISSRLSGTYANARQAAQEVGEDTIQVVDSRTAGGAMYLLIQYAHTLLSGGASLQQAFERLLAARQRTHTLFSIQDMGPLRRSGRLGPVRLSVSALLNIRPVLCVRDGSIVSYGLARGRQEQLRLLEEGARPATGDVIVQYCGEQASAQALAQRLAAAGHTVLLRRVGAVLAIHLGVPVLSIAWMETA